MLRDDFKSKEYFNNGISQMLAFIEEDIEEIKQGKIKKKQIPDVSRGNFRFSLKILFSMYSAGFSKKEIKEYYPESVGLMMDANNQWDKYFEKKFDSFNIRMILIMLSLAILLNASESTVKLLISIVDTVPKRYKILDYYISYFDKSKTIGKEQKSESAYKSINLMANLSNEEILKNDLMGKYLKTWYKNDDRVYLRDTHNNGLDNYVGYWSFESAAFIKMRGLDDSSFRDNSPFYPKDLL